MTTAYVTDTHFATHTLDGHAEFAGRLKAVQDVLDQYGIPQQTRQLIAVEATPDQLLAVHTEEYLKLLQWTTTQDGMQLGPDTYVLPESYQIARLAAGAVIAGVDAVLKGEVNNAMACIRPPGHHATPDMGMGFCLLSNVAIAVRHAQKQHNLKKIMIVDYDVHHGNGTQDTFYDDPDVMFLSTHQSPWYPGTGALTERGSGAGLGATVNVPLPAGTGDNGFAQVFEKIVWPVAKHFAPELIVVSAGFDAHWADPLGQIQLTLNGYDHLTRQLIDMANTLCGGKIIFVMEGGYNLTSLSHAWLNVAYALLGESKLVDPLGAAHNAEPDISQIIEKVIGLHQIGA
jgi:acetoin utilization deacetylase AcuC-like enzyme